MPDLRAAQIGAIMRCKKNAKMCADRGSRPDLAGSPSMIETSHLRLVPATLTLLRAEISNRATFAGLLSAQVPENWPPESLADALPDFLALLEEGPHRAGWLAWYALARAGGDDSSWVLAASGGFRGPPEADAVEIGFSVLPQFQGCGVATEMVQALSAWALGQPGVERVVAETEWANPASARVLAKAGFVARGLAREPAGSRFELARSGRGDGS